MNKRKPHNDLAGYIFERKHPCGHIIIFNAKEAGIDCEHKYVVCVEGNTSSIPRPDVEGIAAHSKDVVINGLISPIRLELLIDQDIPALIAWIEKLEGRIHGMESEIEALHDEARWR